MILVTLGTQNKSFVRLLEQLDKEVMNGTINEEIVVQAGTTKYDSKNMKIFDFLPMEEFENFIGKADLVITHGGVGTIFNSIRRGKKVIAVPRLAKYKEHVNDHQLQIVDSFSKLGYIIGCEDMNNLGKCIIESKTFTPKKYESNNDKFLKIIEDFIDKN